MKTQSLYIFLFLLFSSFLSAQTATVAGVILDEFNNPVENVNVSFGNVATKTDAKGFYTLTVPANKRITIFFSHVSHNQGNATIQLSPGEKYELYFSMTSNAEQLQDVIILNDKKRVQGIVTISPQVIQKNPSAMPGVESVLKTFGGVSANDELTSQYAVRGGNYDENLVYVNEIEVYRPFLIRSGQQEGLSFTNTDMVQNVDFSAGGFQAKYGDKLSSVLDITYRKPNTFGAAFEASLLGGSLTVDLVSKNKKWSSMTGVRYRDNSLLVNSKETESNFRPTFVDVQNIINYTPNQKWLFSFLGNISQNQYNYQPLSRQTNFGTISDPIALQIAYEGQENDKYRTLFGALKTTYNASENSTYKLIGSAYHTQEQEYFDIDAYYFLGEVDTNIGSETFGGVTYNRAIGSQLNHARNDLDALIVNAELKGSNFTKKKFQLDWGIKYTHEDIRDRIVEWEVVDSAGFSLNPPIIDLPVNEQPYTPYTGPLVPFQNVRALNFITIDRLSGYAQLSTKANIGQSVLFVNAGVRAHNWSVSGDGVNSTSQTVFSPRAQLAFKPDADKNLLLRFATGLYYQPPFYRELRRQDGSVNTDVKAQQSIHFVAGADYGFTVGNGDNEKKFKFVAEAFYKTMNDVNTYTLENVRIRYRANNNATAYAYGFDCRLNGEFVKSTESWFSFGYLKTEENQDGRGNIARPTDQRLKFGLLFQDYMPNIPNVKLYLNLVYNTGLPGGSPSYADVYVYENRLRDYRRADVGFSYVFTERNDKRADGHWLKKFRDLSLGFEIFNLFNNQNAITNTWVRDAYTKNQYAIPNYLTSRVFNLKLTARL